MQQRVLFGLCICGRIFNSSLETRLERGLGKCWSVSSRTDHTSLGEKIISGAAPDWQGFSRRAV